MGPDQLGDQFSIILVRPCEIVFSFGDSAGGHGGHCSELALVLEAELVGQDHRNEAKDGEATVAEDANHSGAVEKATNDQEDSVDGHKDENKASHGVGHRPVTAFFLAVVVARSIDYKLQGCSGWLIRVGAVDELDVVVGGVLPKSVIVCDTVVEIVLNCQYVAPLLHLVGT